MLTLTAIWTLICNESDVIHNLNQIRTTTPIEQRQTIDDLLKKHEARRAELHVDFRTVSRLTLREDRPQWNAYATNIVRRY